MHMQWKAIMVVAALSGAPQGIRVAVAAPAPGHDEAPPAALQPAKPEVRPASPEDEALKRLLRQRSTKKGLTLSSGPATRPHKVLGSVNVEGDAPKAPKGDAPTGDSPADTAKGGASPNAGPNLYLNELLRSKAVETYGADNVDGIVSITYETSPDGKQRAKGTAIHFEAAAPSKPPAAKKGADKKSPQ
jgi:hypothetical protein